MKKIFAAVATSLALLGAAPVFAQQAQPDPAAIAASREMFESMNYRNTMVAAMHQMSISMATNMRAASEAAIKNNPRMSDEAKQQALAKLEADLPDRVARVQALLDDPTLVDDIIAETIPVWADTFSVDELHQIAAFYRTPLGAKMLASMPKLMGEGMRTGQQIVARRITALMQQPAPAAQP